jgi:hypothetical protein
MNEGLTLLMGGLGVDLGDIAAHVVKGEKGLSVTRTRAAQLFAGDADDVERAIGGLYRAAKARGWSDGRLIAAVKALAPEHTGQVLLAMLEGSNDATAPYVRDLLRGRVAGGG